MHEYLLGPGDRVRFQDCWLTDLKPHVREVIRSLRGTIIESNDEARECTYHLIKWDNADELDFEVLFKETDCMDLEESIQGDMLEPASADDNNLLGRHSQGTQAVLETAINALFLYDGQMNRSVGGAFYDIVKAMDESIYNELQVQGVEWVHKKYFSEGDQE